MTAKLFFVPPRRIQRWPTYTSTLSHVAALRNSLHLQFIPQAHHLPRRLVMGCDIAFHTTKLAEHQAMQIVHWFCSVKLLYPHSHTHIFHFKQLHKKVNTDNFNHYTQQMPTMKTLETLQDNAENVQ